MSTFLNAAAYVLLLVIVCLIGHIRALKKKHAREVINLVDDATTSRDRLGEARTELKNLYRIQVSDSAMIERLLRGLEADKETRLQMAILLSQYRSLSGLAHDRFKDAIANMMLISPSLAFVADCLTQIVNLENKPDAGKPTKPAAGDGSAASGPTA